jgi:hypothetical protein
MGSIWSHECKMLRAVVGYAFHLGCVVCAPQTSAVPSSPSFDPAVVLAAPTCRRTHCQHLCNHPAGDSHDGGDVRSHGGSSPNPLRKAVRSGGSLSALDRPMVPEQRPEGSAALAGAGSRSGVPGSRDRMRMVQAAPWPAFPMTGVTDRRPSCDRQSPHISCAGCLRSPSRCDGSATAGEDE